MIKRRRRNTKISALRITVTIIWGPDSMVDAESRTFGVLFLQVLLRTLRSRFSFDPRRSKQASERLRYLPRSHSWLWGGGLEPKC